MKVVILKYSSGNIQSIKMALTKIKVKSKISDQPEDIMTADKVIIPGVGEARTAMNYLYKTGLNQLIPKLKKPVLGICLGMQLLCEKSEENNTSCLNIFDITVKKFVNTNSVKIPHIGWNTIYNLKGTLFNSLKDEIYQYFAHSYYVPVNSHTISLTKYINTYSSGIQKENFYGVQFHPEKSGILGYKILQNFIKYV
jgi:imidazole glycerol-phosphate synthase subunit HisH